VTKALDHESLPAGVHQLLKKIKKNVVAVKKSSKLSRDFHAIQVEKKQDLQLEQEEDNVNEEDNKYVDRPLKLVNDVCTRWSSTFRMLERYLLLRKSVDLLFEGNESACLTDDEWMLMKAVVEVLQPFQEAVALLEGDKYCTLSLVWRSICALVDHCIDVQHVCEDEVNLKNQLLLQLTTRFPVTRTVAYAAILDPRSKGLSFVANENERKQWYDSFEQHVKQLYPAPQLQVQGAEQNIAVARKVSFADRMRQGVGGRRDAAAIQDELELYKHAAAPDHETNPLEWWKEKELLFPRLSKLAKKFLAIPASSAPSERLFSHMNFICSKRRNRLLPGNVEKIVFLKMNRDLFH
jgi:hypothetical protein